MKKNIYIKYGIYSTLVFSPLFLILSIYMAFNTYNNAIYKENGRIVYDADFDTLIDYKDPDTDNNGQNNIQDVNKDELVKSTYEILEGKYMASSRNTAWEDLKYRYGALTSFRLISQVYFNQNKPIEPVLKIFAQQEYNIRDYSIDMPYSTLLYAYFNKNEMLRDFDINVPKGNLFFVLDSNQEVENMGILLEDNNVGIVMQGDTEIKIHTLDEVFNLYKENVIKVQR